MLKVWTGTQWKAQDQGTLYVFNGTTWEKSYKTYVRAGSAWLPEPVSNLDTSITLTYSVEAPTVTIAPPTTTVVPDLNGKTYVQALDALIAADLYGDGTSVTTNNLQLDDYVVNNSQNVAAGSNAAIGATVQFQFYNYIPAKVSVPQLNGLTALEARGKLVQFGLDYVESTVETMTPSLVGYVVNNSQNPAAGTQVDEGYNVTYTYYIESSQTIVPNINNLTRTQAQSAIAARSLQISETVEETTNAALVGYVKENSQYPAANATVLKDSYVSYTYYVLDQTTVPNVVGFDYWTAEGTLANAGLNVTSNFTYTTNSAQYNKVYSQSIAAGSTVVSGTAISISYYLQQPTVEVPNLIGLSRTSAQQALANVGLSYSETAGVEGTVDQVYSQSPSSGSDVQPGSTISYTYYTAHVYRWVTYSGSMTRSLTWGATYNGSGNKRSGIDNLYQGYYDSTNGNQRSMWSWNWDALLALTSWNITSASITWYQEWTWSTGTSASWRIGTHDNSSEPSTWSNVSPNLQTRSVLRANSYTVNLNSSIIANLNGSAWGITFGPGADTSQNNYGYVTGTGASRPSITINYTYQVWE